MQREAGPSALKKPAVLKATQLDKLKHPPKPLELDAHDTCNSDLYERFAVHLYMKSRYMGDTAVLDHPFLANRLITTPPINELRIGHGLYDEYYATLDYGSLSDDFEMGPPPRFIVISNVNGVTVGDVYLRYAEQYVTIGLGSI